MLSPLQERVASLVASLDEAVAAATRETHEVDYHWRSGRAALLLVMISYDIQG